MCSFYAFLKLVVLVVLNRVVLVFVPHKTRVKFFKCIFEFQVVYGMVRARRRRTFKREREETTTSEKVKTNHHCHCLDGAQFLCHCCYISFRKQKMETHWEAALPLMLVRERNIYVCMKSILLNIGNIKLP